MSDRDAYNKCMKPYMTGSGPDKKAKFCIGAKVCSGKAKTEEDAARLCVEAKAKAPASGGGKAPRGAKCMAGVDKIINCLIEHTDFDAEDMTAALKKSVPLCVCGKKPKKVSKTEAAIASMTPEQLETVKLIAQMQQEYGTG